MINADTARPEEFPEHIWDGFKRYMLHGIRPGDFLTALLSNDLLEVFNRGDDEALAGLRVTVQFMYNNCPLGSFGDKECFQYWLDVGGLNGFKELQRRTHA